MENLSLLKANVEVFYISSSEGNKRIIINNETYADLNGKMQVNIEFLQKKISLLSSDTIPGYVSVLELHEDGSMLVMNNRYKK